MTVEKGSNLSKWQQTNLFEFWRVVSTIETNQRNPLIRACLLNPYNDPGDLISVPRDQVYKISSTEPHRPIISSDKQHTSFQVSKISPFNNTNLPSQEVLDKEAQNLVEIYSSLVGLFTVGGIVHYDQSPNVTTSTQVLKLPTHKDLPALARMARINTPSNSARNEDILKIKVPDFLELTANPDEPCSGKTLATIQTLLANTGGTIYIFPPDAYLSFHKKLLSDNPDLPHPELFYLLPNVILLELLNRQSSSPIRVFEIDVNDHSTKSLTEYYHLNPAAQAVTSIILQDLYTLKILNSPTSPWHPKTWFNKVFGN